MTVQELLTGVPGPLSNAEFVSWNAYFKVKQSKEEQANRKASRKGRSGRGRKG